MNKKQAFKGEIAFKMLVFCMLFLVYVDILVD